MRCLEGGEVFLVFTDCGIVGEKEFMDPSRILLRPGTLADDEFCFNVMKEALGGYIAQVWGWNEQFVREFHRDEFERSQPNIIVWDGRDIGTVEVVREKSEWVLTRFYLLPEFQGQGIGSVLMRQVILEAEEAGLPIRLRVLKNNPARRLYERFGFVVVDETEMNYVMRRETK